MNKVFIILIIIFPFFCFAQVKNIGTPNIKNYPKSIYGAGTQNWGICQDRNGFIYFANKDGLLCFDGVRWNVHEISDNSAVRSVLADSKNNIYVGLEHDFGIFKQNESEKPVFTSFKHLLPPDIGSFDDIWRIHEIQDGIVFQCFNYLFLYKNDNIEILKPQNNFHYSFQIDDRLFIHEPDIGVFELIDGKLIKMPYWEEHKEKAISAILETENNEILVCTSRHGIYKFENEKIEQWDTPVNDFIQKNRLYSATSIPGNYFAFGTILNGLVIADSNGNVVQTLNSSNGIQNNTILSLFVDASENLWLGLDNGIDYVEINSPISFIGNSDNLGTGYCCKIFNGHLYLGTNQGLYVRAFSEFNINQPFVLVENTAGQVWSLETFDGNLICGHNLGTFIVRGNIATKIGNEPGAWKYISPNNKPGYLLGGHYNGLAVLKKQGVSWMFDKMLKGFQESSRYLFQDESGHIWVGHGAKGIYRLTINEQLDSVMNVEHYTSAKGLPANTANILFKYNNKIYVSANDGIYTFNAAKDSFVPSEELNKVFNTNGKIMAVVTDEQDDTWYIAGDESGVIRKNEDLTSTRISSPFKLLDDKYVDEFESIYPFDNDNVFVGINEGFAHYSSTIKKSYSDSFKSFITRIELSYIDSIIYLQQSQATIEYEFPFRKNTIRFYFAAPYFENNTPLLFSYFLEGFSEDWSEWSSDTYKDFTNLHESDYILKLKAKNIYDVESEVSTYGYTILPPWHRSKQAYFVYIALFLLLSFALVKYILYRLKLSKLKEEKRHQQEIEEKEKKFQREALITEKEIIKLRNDKLLTEMMHRDKELANQTMGIIQKNKFLIRIKEDLKGIQDFIQNDTAINKVSSLKRRIAKEIDIKQQNKIFETYFDEVHEEFFKRLKEKYHELTPNDLRICAFIRMNLTTQEIATVLNISYRGAEISRYRLRKKLELSRGTNLSSFLTNI